MKLLKYPLDLPSGPIKTLSIIGPHILIAGCRGHVEVWSHDELCKAAFDPGSISNLQCVVSGTVPIDEYNQYGEMGRQIDFISGDSALLFVASKYEIYRCKAWLDNLKTDFKYGRRLVFRTTDIAKDAIISDVKYLKRWKLLFVAVQSIGDENSDTNSNKVLLFNSKNLRLVSEIALPKESKPATIVLDPIYEVVFIFCLNGTLFVHQINSAGMTKFVSQQKNKMTLSENLIYRINMSPEASYIPTLTTPIDDPQSNDDTMNVNLLTRIKDMEISEPFPTKTSITSSVFQFSQQIYEKINKKGVKSVYSLLATSGTDKGSIIIWNTLRKKPLFNSLNLSSSPINDITWTDDGMSLFAISDSNYLYSFAFEKTDLGTTLNSNQLSILRRKNRKHSSLPLSTGFHNTAILSDKEQNLNSLTRNSNNISITESPIIIDDNEQINDNINNNNNNNNIVKQNGNTIELINNEIDDKKINKEDEKQKQKQNSNDKPKTIKVKPDSVSQDKSGSKKSTTPPVKEEPKGPEIKTLIPKKKKSSKVKSSTTLVNNSEFNPPSYHVPKDLKRKPKLDSEGNVIHVKKNKKDLEQLDFLDTSLIFPNTAFSRVRLATPRIKLNFEYTSPNDPNYIVKIKNGSGNEQKPSSISLHHKGTENTNQLFEDFIPKYITICTAGSSFWACATHDGMIYVYSDTGRKLLPPAILGVPISFLEACSKYLLCVTSIGQMYCWNIEEKKLHFPINSVYALLNPSIRYSDDVLTRAENITLCGINTSGIPLVTLSDGDGYIFDKDMETWLLVSDSWWAYGSQYWDMSNTSIVSTNNSEDTTKKNDNANLLSHQLVDTIKKDKGSLANFMESKTNTELHRKGRVKNLQRLFRTILIKEGFENIEEAITLAHLENRLLISLKIGEDKEFSDLLNLYAFRLADLDYVDRLDDILQWLYNGGDYINSKIANISRKEHIQNILVTCANMRNVQRVTTNYARAIGMVNDEI